MGDLKLKVWTSPKDAQVRVYIDTRHVWHSDECKAADGSYLYAGADGEVKVWFRPNMSGEPGHATFAVRDYLQAKVISFAEFLARIEAAKTPAGNFSAVRYFRNLRGSMAEAA